MSRFEVQFILTSKPHQLESGLQKKGGLPVRVGETETGLSSHHHSNISKIIDHRLTKYGLFTKLEVRISILSSLLSSFLFSSDDVAMRTDASL